MTEELLTNDEEDVAELEDTALLELFAEDELATLDELAALLLLLTEELLTNDEEDVAELEDITLLELFVEDELKNRVAPPIISSSAEASFAEIFVHSPSKQRRKSLPTASATQPSNFSSQTFSPLPSANAITSLVPFSTELEPLSSPQAIKKRDDTKAIDESIFINIVDTSLHKETRLPYICNIAILSESYKDLTRENKKKKDELSQKSLLQRNKFISIPTYFHLTYKH